MEKPLKLIIEALLFASPDPLSQKEMGNCLPEIPLLEIKDALAELQVDYRPWTGASPSKRWRGDSI